MPLATSRRAFLLTENQNDLQRKNRIHHFGGVDVYPSSGEYFVESRQPIATRRCEPASTVHCAKHAAGRPASGDRHGFGEHRREKQCRATQGSAGFSRHQSWRQSWAGGQSKVKIDGK